MRVCVLFTAPDPPSNLSVSVKSGKSAVISLSPPSKGNFSSFKLRVSTMDCVAVSVREHHENEYSNELI